MSTAYREPGEKRDRARWGVLGAVLLSAMAWVALLAIILKLAARL
jgi:hypothetical protein